MKRLWTVSILLMLALVATACTGPSSSSGDAGGDGFRTISLRDFPEGLGSGFPVAQVDGESADAEVGGPAPNFAFVLPDGRGADLASLQGKPVVVNFWATWCGPCRAEMPELVALHETNPQVVVLEVNVQENLDAIRPFAEEFNMTMPVIVDQPGAIRKMYGVRNMPTTVFVNPDGTIGVRWAGLLTGDQLAQFVGEVSAQ